MQLLESNEADAQRLRAQRQMLVETAERTCLHAGGEGRGRTRFSTYEMAEEHRQSLVPKHRVADEDHAVVELHSATGRAPQRFHH